MSHVVSLAAARAARDAVVPEAPGPASRGVGALVESLRRVALRRLASMYRGEHGLFVFRADLDRGRMVASGLSRRYTAIALIGLAREDPSIRREILGGQAAEALCDRLLHDAETRGNLGDLALSVWAATALDAGSRRHGHELLRVAEPHVRPCTVVELAWTLSALSVEASPALDDLRRPVAQRLKRLFAPRADAFPHHTEPRFGVRSHVACFADLIYPVLALAQYAAVSGDAESIHLASLTAQHLCTLQGASGQWWWHYDVRSPRIIERYPVYAVHQHGMAPMALAALRHISGTDFSRAVVAGLRWLQIAPELSGRGLFDDTEAIVWRKVGRREPAKASRYLQAVTSRLHPGGVWPGLDRLFPPNRIDREHRPYEWGWLLYAWPPGEADRLASGVDAT